MSRVRRVAPAILAGVVIAVHLLDVTTFDPLIGLAVAVGGAAALAVNRPRPMPLWGAMLVGASLVGVEHITPAAHVETVGWVGRTTLIVAAGVLLRRRRVSHGVSGLLDSAILTGVGLLATIDLAILPLVDAGLTPELAVRSAQRAIASTLVVSIVARLGLGRGETSVTQPFLTGAAGMLAVGDVLGARFIASASPPTDLPVGLHLAAGILFVGALLQLDMSDAGDRWVPNRAEVLARRMRVLSPALSIPAAILGARVAANAPVPVLSAALLAVILVLVLSRLRGLGADTDRLRALNRSRERRLRALLEASADVVVLVDREGTVLHASESLSQHFGWSPGYVLAGPLTRILRSEDHDLVRIALEALEPGHTSTTEVAVHRHDRTIAWVDLILKDRTDDEHVAGVVAVLRDVSERRAVTDDLRRVVDRQSIIVDLGRTAMAGADAAELHRTVLHGLTTQEDLVSCEFWATGSTGQLELIAASGRFAHLARRVRVDPRGNSLPALAATRGTAIATSNLPSDRSVSPPPELTTNDVGPALAVPVSGSEHDVVCVARYQRGAAVAPDVASHMGAVLSAWALADRRRQAEDVIAEQARTDALTGLANRSVFNASIDALDPSGRHAVIFCDLDGFKPVNDTHGHDAGDALLISVSRRLEAAAGPDALVARLGGDEFTVVCPHIGSPDDALVVAHAACDAIAEPHRLGSIEVEVSASVGVAVSSPHLSISGLLGAADAAMYTAKSAGKNRVALAGSPTASPSGRVSVPAGAPVGERPSHDPTEELIQQATDVASTELLVAPVRSSDGSIVAMTADGAWTIPALGTVTGASIPADHPRRWRVDQRIIVAAIEQLATWSRSGGPNLPIRVPISDALLGMDGVADRIAELCHGAELKPTSLVAVIQPSAWGHPTRSVNLQGLARHGIQRLVAVSDAVMSPNGAAEGLLTPAGPIDPSTVQRLDEAARSGWVLHSRSESLVGVLPIATLGLPVSEAGRPAASLVPGSPAPSPAPGTAPGPPSPPPPRTLPARSPSVEATSGR